MAETPFRPLNVIAGADPTLPVTAVNFDPHQELLWTANDSVMFKSIRLNSPLISCSIYCLLNNVFLIHRATSRPTMAQDCSGTLATKPTKVLSVK